MKKQGYAFYFLLILMICRDIFVVSKIKTQISFHFKCLGLFLLLKIQILRHLLLLRRPTISLSTGFRRGQQHLLVTSPIRLHLPCLLLIDLLYFRVAKISLGFLDLAVGNPAEHRQIYVFVEEVLLDMLVAALGLERLQFFERMYVLIPPLNVYKDIF